MRIVVIAVAGLLVVGGIGGAAIALMPTGDGTPLDSIRVEAPQSISPAPPAPQQPTARPALPPPSARTPPPADSRGVPQPPPPVVQSPQRGGWDDDDDDDRDDGGDDD